MTTCGVNTLLNKTHLIADTLVSKKPSKMTESKILLSLGMVLESSEFYYNENRLKIWKLRENVALAYAGDVIIAEEMLTCLHKLLDENVKGGKTKVVQHKQFESHFKFEKMGHKYKILEIYNEPLKVIDNRDTGNHTIYQMH